MNVSCSRQGRLVIFESGASPEFMEIAAVHADGVFIAQDNLDDAKLLVNQGHPSGHEDFIDLVVPILQVKGIFRTEYEADKLRGGLILPYPEQGGINRRKRES